ncbi:type I methionyl aminopeptidase [bacterium]|nr:type I methionyl aminopeptidase [bacterium]
MIVIKSQSEIEIMAQAGKILSSILKKIARKLKPGISTLELDRLAENLIIEAGCKPAFKGYSGYPATLCISINDEVVHGIPSAKRIIKNGDIVDLDLGLKYKGYYSDMSRTYGVGKISQRAKKLIKVTRKSLDLAIKIIKPGIYLGDISSTIQGYVEKNGFSVVRDLTGHGIGKKLHEDPPIFNFGKPKTGPILKQGMVFAIEPMVNEGKSNVEVLDDGWTIVTADGSLSAHFEDTVAVIKNGYRILTR